jgi:tyrosinase
MTNLWTSTNDPLFWMHHTELDRLWAIWQGSNDTRLGDVAAPVELSFGQMMGRTKPTTKTTKASMVWMGQFPPSLAIGRVTDTQNRDGQGVLCYRYEG